MQLKKANRRRWRHQAAGAAQAMEIAMENHNAKAARAALLELDTIGARIDPATRRAVAKMRGHGAVGPVAILACLFWGIGILLAPWTFLGIAGCLVGASLLWAALERIRVIKNQ